MISFSYAKKLYEQGQYHEAIKEYKKIGEVFGFSLVEYNINSCIRKMELVEEIGLKPERTYQSAVNEIFDKVYVVNLSFHVEKRLKVCNQLKNNGIDFTVFNAVNGHQSEVRSQFEDYKNKPLGNLKKFPEWNEREIQRGKHYIESAGALGYIHTYIKILREAKESNYNKILILEDDIILRNNFENYFLDFISSIRKDWKVLQLGASQYIWDNIDIHDATQKGYYFPKQIETCGSFAIALDLSVADELIRNLEFFEAPFDHLPLGEIYNKNIGRCYVAYPNIVMPDVGVSFIRGQRNQYDHALKMHWNIEDFEYPLRKVSVSLIVTSGYQLKYIESFNDHINSVFNLKLYYQSKDGLRPIHDIQDAIEKNEFSSSDRVINTDLSTDFIGEVIPSVAITEKNILEFIEFCLKLRSKNISPIRDLSHKYIPIVKKNMVSVIITTYKRKESLFNAVSSVIHQDYLNKEIIIVDDNIDQDFSDSVVSTVSKLISENPSCDIKYVKHSINRNGSSARNTGVLSSVGQYICFLDDDDTYLPGRISLSVDALKNSPNEIGAVYCGFLGWNSPKNDLNRYPEGDLTISLLTLNKTHNYLHTNTATYKRTALIDINLFDESYRRHQDLELNIRFFQKYKIKSVKEALVRLKPEPNLTTNHSNMVFNNDMIELKKKFLKKFHEIIINYDEDTVRTIYESNWREAFKNMDEKSRSNLKLDCMNPLNYI